MLRITVIAVGKVKMPWIAEGVREWETRLRPYAKVDVIEVAAESFRREQEKTEAMGDEAERILKLIEARPLSPVFLLDERGKEYDSREFAWFLGNQEGKEIVFVIGGALGLDASLQEKFSGKVALSRMTLPHEMARLIFLEQLFRAVTIQQGKAYHY
ncbi:MAG: 23S rRNA (pseudouridine(1915)-N(3))-methyltransferase RlmH [Patescibacteria group bacterium]